MVDRYASLIVFSCHRNIFLSVKKVVGKRLPDLTNRK